MFLKEYKQVNFFKCPWPFKRAPTLQGIPLRFGVIEVFAKGFFCKVSGN
jgi:hypothetical protein